MARTSAVSLSVNRIAVIALLFVVTSAQAAERIDKKAEYLRAYVAALRFANEANQPFMSMSHMETGTPAQLTEFIAQSRMAHDALEHAAEHVAPFMASRNRAVAKSAALAKDVFEARQKLCERWRALYADMSKPEAASDPSIAARFSRLRAEIDRVGENLGASAVAASWGIVNVDRRGNPRGWGVSSRDRKHAVDELKKTFGDSITAGPRPGMNYLETAAAAMSSFLILDNWKGAPPT
ncbi:MAG: hypothetical protein QOI24_3279 [Acidobacteriota bacterium]|jgi:hypothetical protein|nr:hypothetical protein [Acidobacteriota bacterium]